MATNPTQSQSGSMHSAVNYTKGLEVALGRVIADAQRQLETYRAQTDALIAGLQARLTETELRCAAMETAARQAVDERLATVRDGADVDMDAVMRRIDEALGAIPAPENGKDADPEVVRSMVQDAVAEAVAAMEPPQAPDVAPLVEAAVRAAVEALPPPLNGVDGKDGDPGERGPAGADADMDALREHVAAEVKAAIPSRDELRGPPGRLPAVRSWTDEVHYEGAVVAHRGALWQAAADTGRPPPHADWVCLAARGEDGRSVDVRGTYDKGEEYRYLDIVALNGGSFIALRDAPGDCPGDGWQLLAGRGKPGQAIKGDKGEKGDAGHGEPGAPVVAMMVDDAGMLTLTNGDGSEVKADFYPILSGLK